MRSSRRLEAETARNLEVMWLLRGLRPDFKTIADFRKDNRHAFKPVFRQFVLLCRKLDLLDESCLPSTGPLNSHAKCNAGIDRSCNGSEV